MYGKVNFTCVLAIVLKLGTHEWGGGGGDQLLSLELSEIVLFLLHLTYGRGRPVSTQLLSTSFWVSLPLSKDSLSGR